MSRGISYILLFVALFFHGAWAQVTTANIFIPFAADNPSLQSALRASVVTTKDKSTVFVATCTAGPCTAIPGGSGTLTFTAGAETFIYTAAPNAQNTVDYRCTFKDCLTKPDIECSRTEISSGSTTTSTTKAESTNLMTLTLNHQVPSPTEAKCTSKKTKNKTAGSSKSKSANKGKSEGASDRGVNRILLSMMTVAAVVGAMAVAL